MHIEEAENTITDTYLPGSGPDYNLESLPSLEGMRRAVLIRLKEFKRKLLFLASDNYLPFAPPRILENDKPG